MKNLKIFYGKGYANHIDIAVCTEEGANFLFDLLSNTKDVVVYKVSDELVD